MKDISTNRIALLTCMRWLLIFTAGLLSSDLVAQQPTTENSTAGKIVPVIELSGDAYERGLQHGKLLQPEISAVFSKWKANIRLAIQADPDSVLTAFLTATDFEKSTKKYAPAMLEEINGIAKGSGQPFKDVFAFQLVDEFWVYLDKQFNTKNHHCSGMGVAATKSHPAYIAQNTDLEGYMHGYQVLFHIAATKKEPEQYILSCAGLVAFRPELYPWNCRQCV
jgi:isopenicillin-N N-acyltransferase-like protein